MDGRINKMGTSKTPKSEQDLGKLSRKDKRFEELWGHLYSELGKLSLVAGRTKEAIRQSDYRRVESFQRPLDETFQSAEKTLKELQATYYSDRYPNTTGLG